MTFNGFPIICLMGPTASGKTALALELIKRFPCEIISVDSAQVYCGMDIGTAKPSPKILQAAPHRLIDILDPKEPYSAGQFRADALREIRAVQALEKIPLLVGGTMLYFRALQQGLAELPSANPKIRAEIKEESDLYGWGHMHAELQKIDPEAAARIHVSDQQRIQRALEIYRLTQKTMSALLAEQKNRSLKYRFLNLIIAPDDRSKLQTDIEKRFKKMLALGFIDEVLSLYKRSDLSIDLPSIRSVGYRQAWKYLAGEISEREMIEKAIIATRQLAKRQLTWLRSWPDANYVTSVCDAVQIISSSLDRQTSVIP